MFDTEPQAGRLSSREQKKAAAVVVSPSINNGVCFSISNLWAS
jgi:hypothetical protein